MLHNECYIATSSCAEIPWNELQQSSAIYKRFGLTERAFHQTIRNVSFVYFETHLFLARTTGQQTWNEIKYNNVFQSVHLWFEVVLYWQLLPWLVYEEDLLLFLCWIDQDILVQVNINVLKCFVTECYFNLASISSSFSVPLFLLLLRYFDRSVCFS